MNARSFLLLVLAACRPPGPAETAAVESAVPLMSRRSLPFDGDPNGLLWSGGRLLATDDDHNRVLVWSDGGAFTTFAELPPVGSAHVGVGGIVQLRDGTLVVARLGDVGDVVVIRPGRPPEVIGGLDPKRRRIGLAVGPDDRVFATWFVREGDVRKGGVAEIDLAGGERDLVGDLQKPVGIVAVDGALVVSDQFGKRLVRVTLEERPQLTEIVAGVDGPDLLAALHDGTVLTGDANGRLLAVDRHGGVREIAAGLPGPRGLAIDEAAGRLFVAVHGGEGVPPRVVILPLP